jgi:hypothetical protein
MAYREDPDSVTRKWVNDLNRDVKRFAWTDVPAVVARLLHSGDRRLVFLLNTVDARVPVTLHVAREGPHAPMAREILDDTTVQWAAEQPTLQLREELPPYGTRCYVLEPAGS